VTVERTVSWLEMNHQAQLVPSPAVVGVRMELWKGDLATLRSVHDEIATPHRWPSLGWSLQHRERRLADPRVRLFVMSVDGQEVALIVVFTVPGLAGRVRTRLASGDSAPELE